MPGGNRKLSSKPARVETYLLLTLIGGLAGYFLPWSQGARGLVFEIQAYLLDMNSHVAGTSSLHLGEYGRWDFFLLAFIIPLAAWFASTALLLVLSCVSVIARCALVKTLFALCWVGMAAPLTFLQMYAFPPSHYRLWVLAAHMGSGWYLSLACGLVAGCLATYLLQREKNVATNGSWQIRGASPTHVGTTALLPALYALLIGGVVVTVYGFAQAWVLEEAIHFIHLGVSLHISGNDYSGPIILVPILASLTLVLLAVGRMPSLRANRAPGLAVQGFAILGISLVFFWWVVFPRGYATSKSTTFQYVKLEYGWFLSLAGLLLILGCLLFIDSLDANRRLLAKQ